MQVATELPAKIAPKRRPVALMSSILSLARTVKSIGGSCGPFPRRTRGLGTSFHKTCGISSASFRNKSCVRMLAKKYQLLPIDRRPSTASSIFRTKLQKVFQLRFRTHFPVHTRFVGGRSPVSGASRSYVVSNTALCWLSGVN